MTNGFRIYRANPEPALAKALAEVTLDCEECEWSVGVMQSLPRRKAIAFWRNALTSVARGERIILFAEEAGSSRIVGTAQVLLTTATDQPHRAEVATLQVQRHARRRGLGATLMQAVEAAAREAGKTLLVLDAITGSEAERLYVGMGWRRCGVMRSYTLRPQGGVCSTTVFYRILAD